MKARTFKKLGRFSTAYLFEATFKLLTVSAMYSLSSGPIPMWLPKKNYCRMIVWEFVSCPTVL